MHPNALAYIGSDSLPPQFLANNDQFSFDPSSAAAVN